MRGIGVRGSGDRRECGEFNPLSKIRSAPKFNNDQTLVGEIVRELSKPVNFVKYSNAYILTHSRNSSEILVAHRLHNLSVSETTPDRRGVHMSYLIKAVREFFTPMTKEDCEAEKAILRALENMGL